MGDYTLLRCSDHPRTGDELIGVDVNSLKPLPAARDLDQPVDDYGHRFSAPQIQA